MKERPKPHRKCVCHSQEHSALKENNPYDSSNFLKATFGFRSPLVCGNIKFSRLLFFVVKLGKNLGEKSESCVVRLLMCGLLLLVVNYLNCCYTFLV